MEYTEVARTRIRASRRIGLGTWAIGGRIGDGSDDDVWVATIQNARDLRNNLIGTAPADG
jgi:aryl-alcohol dehydrogenase-like predicted oxidoreductase